MRRFLRQTLAFLALLALAAPAMAQQRTITGEVRGPDGEPVVLASVLVVGTSLAVGTNAEGRFEVTVPSGEVRLRIEHLGFKPTTVTLTPGQSTVSVTLEQDVLNLEGIVVTGQATSVQRRNLANAVATVTPEMIESAPPAQSIEKVMQGQVPGALIEQNSGAPGGGIQVRLRGVSTIIGESEPLWVVDGVIVSNVGIPSNANAVTAAAGGTNGSNQDNVVNRIADLDPAQIERIEILKGASAAALYGSRASNGVILITTKRGVPGAQRIAVTQRFGTYDLSNKFGFREWTRDDALAAYVDADDGTAADTAFISSYFNPDGSPVFDGDLEEELAGNNDLSWETNVSLSGGNETTRYFASGSIRSDEGVIANTFYDKQSFRLNLTQALGDRVQVDFNSNLIHSTADRGLTNNDNSGTSYYMVLPFTPSFVDLRPGTDGLFPDNPFERSNPLQTAGLMSNEEDVWRFLGAVNATARAFERGSHRVDLIGTVGVDYFQQTNDLLFPAELQFEPSDGLPGSRLLSESDNRDLTFTGNVVYGFRGDGFESTTTAGAQYEDRELSIGRITSQGLTAGQPGVDAGVVTGVTDQQSRVKDMGFFGHQEVLALDERLLVTAGLRADRSSVNADVDKFYFYPKASASYRFEELATFLDALKIRAAWGQSGNQPLYGQKFTPLTATNNIDGIPGLVVQGTVAAPDLKPERQTEIEAGVDVTLFGSRAQLEATVFRKIVNDLLLQRVPAPSTGFALEIFNGGQMQVNGLELSFLASPVQMDEFGWVSRTTFYADRSEITELPVPAFEVGGFGTGLGAFRVEQGKSATQIVGTVGVDDDGNDIVETLGDATPDFRMHFSNDFTVGPFALRSLFDWASGNSIINLTRLLADAGQNTVDYTTPVDCPAFGVQMGAGECRISTAFGASDIRPYVEDAGYIKLRELSLEYAIPAAAIDRLLGGSIVSASVALSGRDLYTWTDYTGVDPEVSNFGNQPIARNIDVAPYPPSRSFWLTMRVTF